MDIETTKKHRIKKLSRLVCDRIAAGEVIERPASVVRELIDNAIDAQAKRIQVRLVEGGRTGIELVDDGIGMSNEDAHIAFERHTTSKINQLEDIYAITSMGFRGEALASMASVALMEIETKSKFDTEEPGISIQLENGEIVSEKRINRTPGTTLRVNNLFYNVPVRANYLKQTGTELRHAKKEFILKTLPFHEISFELEHNGRIIIQTKSSDSILQRIRDYFTDELVTQLIPLDRQSMIDDIIVTATGYITNPTYTLKHKRDIYIFVNGRPIYSANLMHAVLQGYENLLPSQAFPCTFIYFTIPPEFLDVNIHPTKREIKFKNESYVHGFLVKAIREAFGVSQTYIPDYKWNTESQEQQNQHSADIQNHSEHQRPSSPMEALQTTPDSKQSINRFHAQSPSSNYEPTKTEGAKGTTAKDEAHENNQHEWNVLQGIQILTQKFQPKTQTDAEKNNTQNNPKHNNSTTPFAIPEYESLNLVGTLFDTYIMLEAPDCMILVDQHAAHERVNFERLRIALEKEKITVQNMLLPILIHVDRDAESWIMNHVDQFKKLGITLEWFGPGSFQLLHVPDFIPKNKEKEVIMEIIQRLSTEAEITPFHLLEEVLKTRACHLSITAGMPQTKDEIAALLRLLFEYLNPFTCPHGRPIDIKIKNNELEKQFKRLG